MLEDIENIYKLMYEAMINKNDKILSEILDESFILIHMSGMKQTKEEFIQAVKDNKLNYYSAKHEDIDIKINESEAKLIGKSFVNAAVFGGGRNNWRLQLDIVLVKKNNKWKIIKGTASIY